MKRQALFLALLPTAALSLGGCVAAGDVRPYPPMAPVAPLAATATPATPGAIYPGGQGLSLYADRVARDVGDLLTIQLVESTTAQTSASTQVAKNGQIEVSAPALFGGPVTYHGRDILSASAAAEREFDGQGRSQQSNRLQGSVTVTVVQRLPNGNLVVQGEKNLRLNQGDELVQIQGIVRPADIGHDNTVPSSKVGQARIVYGGRGALAQSNAMGWLGRFFNSRLAPY
ncbi:flagellar basal body L-ring protein FlgH [Pseudoxanthomonas sp. J35]|uniref:flagellar basal body L-ring protein FlgH n=1 Tax=Pseudoxanthomonas sp. J35 TaxID=935852 RepID=UPI00048D999E|nr:flagellar basal body L-ring protein FlgH [Pseudoxanthomonas sp. J35]